CPSPPAEIHGSAPASAPIHGPGRRTSGWIQSCSSTGTRATSSTAIATGPWTRSWPTSTPAGIPSMSRSRTGATTRTSARWCATPTRSWPRASTSSDVAAGTGGERWSPSATSTSSSIPTSTRWPPGRRRRRCRCSASTTSPAASRSTPTRCRRAASCSSGRRGRGCRPRPVPCARRCWPSGSSAPPARSTPGRPRPWRCTSGSAATPPVPGRTGSRPHPRTDRPADTAPATRARACPRPAPG
ncbi:MAG: POSSIBLE RNA METHYLTRANSFERASE (RNA METHYLASE), partial [uncultured Solirubrobacteraceae bacterium]